LLKSIAGIIAEVAVEIIAEIIGGLNAEVAARFIAEIIAENALRKQHCHFFGNSLEPMLPLHIDPKLTL